MKESLVSYDASFNELPLHIPPTSFLAIESRIPPIIIAMHVSPIIEKEKWAKCYLKV